MTNPTARTRAPAAFATALALALLPTAASVAGQGSGNPTLTVNPASVPSDTATIVDVTGTDFLVPPHAPGAAVFGGVYLFFGYVEAGKKWGPSARNVENTDGQFGATYFYPGEGGGADTRTDAPDDGTTGMISFTDAGESGDATTVHMDDNGNWAAKVKIPGATFSTALPDGGKRDFDCRQVTCGIFTIGAHGKSSATNEKFTPVIFAPAPAAPPPAAVPSPEPVVSQAPVTTALAQPVPHDITSDHEDDSVPADEKPAEEATASAPSPATSAGSQPLDGETVAVGVSTVSDVGGGGGALPVVGAVGVLIAGGAIAIALRRSRHRNAAG